MALYYYQSVLLFRIKAEDLDKDHKSRNDNAKSKREASALNAAHDSNKAEEADKRENYLNYIYNACRRECGDRASDKVKHRGIVVARLGANEAAVALVLMILICSVHNNLRYGFSVFGSL